MADEPQAFNFCIGRPWPTGPSNPDGTALNIYARGAQVHHGTMEYADTVRQYVNRMTGEENFIYELVKVEP